MVVDLEEMYETTKLAKLYFKVLKKGLVSVDLFNQYRHVLDSLFVKHNEQFYRVVSAYLQARPICTVESVNYILDQMNTVVQVEHVGEEVFNEEDTKLVSPVLIPHS